MNNVSTDRASHGKLSTVLKVCAGLCLLTLTSAVVASFLMPRRYFSKVIMELSPEASGSVAQFGPESVRRAYDPQYIQTQFAILQKPEILYPVIQRLDLTRSYAPPGTTISQTEAYRRLRASMRLREVSDISFVWIGISDTDPQRAANLANAIATVYLEQTVRKRDVEEILGPAKAEMEAQRKRLEEASRLAVEIRARNGITDPAPEKWSAVLAFTANAAPLNDPTADEIAAKAKMTEYLEAKRQVLRERRILQRAEQVYVQAANRPRTLIWEKAERADQPENRIASLLDSVWH